MRTKKKIIYALSFMACSVIYGQKQAKKVTVYTTAEISQQKLSKTDELFFSPASQPLETEISIFVEPLKTFQTILGIGGAITDASAEVFAKLSPAKQKEFINAYYDKTSGIAYSIIRTNMNSCDFSSESYSYVKEGDKSLQSFSVEHDKKYRIPLIKKALAASRANTTVFVSPWSPPAFMKDNKNMLNGGKLLPEYYQAWAEYYVKFIKSYQKEGIPIWGLTIQNEPMAVQPWESCIYTAEEERDFLKNYLGPTIKKELPGKKIIVWDHNRDMINHRADIIFSDSEASKYAWGIGFHWYETWTGGKPMFENISKVARAYPDKNIMFTEGCVEKFDSTKYHFWLNAERYGESILNDFNNGTAGWTDWNILLDEKGGPNHVGNFCFAPIHADTTTGELIYTPSYYYIGHFSKFIHQNAKLISSAVSRSSLQSASFLNTDGNIATIILNTSDKEVKYNLIVGTQKIINTIPSHGIQTLIY